MMRMSNRPLRLLHDDDGGMAVGQMSRRKLVSVISTILFLPLNDFSHSANPNPRRRSETNKPFFSSNPRPFTLPKPSKKILSQSISTMAPNPFPSIVVITITDYSTVYPSPTPNPDFPIATPFVPPSATPSITASSTAIPAPSASPSQNLAKGEAFDISSLTPMFIAISCVALLLVILFTYTVWSKCCIGGRFGFKFGCGRCKELKEELGLWKNGEKKCITPDMVRQRESYNSGMGMGEGVGSTGPTVLPYHANDGNSNNDYDTIIPSRDFNADPGANAVGRESAREHTLATLEGRLPQHAQRPPSLPANPFWDGLKVRFTKFGKGKAAEPSARAISDDDRFFNLHPNAINPRPFSYSPSKYSQTTYEPSFQHQHQHQPRSFLEYGAPSIPLEPLPRRPRTSEEAPNTYSAYLTNDYAARDKERKILLAEAGLDSREYKEAEQAIARNSIATAELQRHLDVVNQVERDVHRARHPSLYSAETRAKERFSDPGGIEDY
ncbi:hypothetical protein IAQ61_000597 [Plenodomus lingam]|uniref:uncharacterized protein n=1 Tax=Leptosphaeria maculans TaxID=5022 RepID=UPI00332B0986|nr:hypothetical protein IAQ61_000597 [Plenodomus lingam]